MRPLRESEATLVPVVRVTGVLPPTRLVYMDGAFQSYHSLRVKGSAAFFLPAFIFLPSFLFLPTAMVTPARSG
jgi:hypothetical protein